MLRLLCQEFGSLPRRDQQVKPKLDDLRFLFFTEKCDRNVLL